MERPKDYPERYKEHFEEYWAFGPVGSWVLLLVFCVFIVAWGMVHMLVLEKPADWDFGAVPDAPGESIYSVRQPPAMVGRPPLQIERLPEGVPLDAEPEGGTLPPSQGHGGLL